MAVARRFGDGRCPDCGERKFGALMGGESSEMCLNCEEQR